MTDPPENPDSLRLYDDPDLNALHGGPPKENPDSLTDAEKLEKIRQLLEVARSDKSKAYWATLVAIEMVLDR
jgi:hypothetical protein